MPGSQSNLEIARAIVQVLEGSGKCDAALATVIRRAGSAPQVEGARLLLYADGRMLGTVGGGAIEAKVVEACQETLRTGLNRRVEANLIRDLAMCCGGLMEVFVEYLSAHPRLILIGAGHVAQAIAPVVTALGFRLTVVDDRESMLTRPCFEQADRRAFDTDELADALPDLDPRDSLLIATRDHQRDEHALAHLIERPHAYLGMIGSQRKVRRVLARILRRFDERERARPDLSRVHAPVGLALGGRTPAEIAVSIAAQLIALRHGGAGTSMDLVERLAGSTPNEIVDAAKKEAP